MAVARILNRPLLEASGLGAQDWYPVLEPWAEELEAPPPGFIWVLIKEQPRQIWRGHLEIQPRVLALAPCCRLQSWGGRPLDPR